MARRSQISAISATALFTQVTVNQLEVFVDHVKGNHANNFQSIWRNWQKKRTMTRIQSTMLDSHINKFICYNKAEDDIKLFVHIFDWYSV